jgi:hypothetical protein
MDNGANHCLAGANMRLLEQAELPELVDIVGASDEVLPGLKGLSIGTYCCVARASSGERILLVVPNCIGYGRGKSIFSEAQLEAHGVSCDSKSRRNGGAQRFTTSDGFVCKLKVRNALTVCPIELPSDEDIATLMRVHITSEGVWNPDELNDDEEDDAWYDAIDDDALTDADYYDSLDNWFDAEENLADFEERWISSASRRSLNVIKACVNGLSKVKQPVDFDALRPFFGWKSAQVVAKTLAATTQYARNVVHLPFRQHYKSRHPSLRVNRLNEVYATDTFYANCKAHNGSECAQLFTGRRSFFTSLHPMNSESEMPGSLMDFIRTYGAMSGLFIDNAKAQCGKVVEKILRMYNIKDMQTEPHHPWQNPAERCIQEVKATTNVILDRTGAPKVMWLLCMMYVVFLLNHLAHEKINWRTPIEAAFGVTPDVSALLCFQFYEPVVYFQPDASFPGSKEKFGRFVGFAENVGDALTFKILTDDTKVIHRSNVRPARTLVIPTCVLLRWMGRIVFRVQKSKLKKLSKSSMLTRTTLIQLDPHGYS